MFRTFTGPSSGVSWAAVMLPFGLLTVRVSVEVALPYLHGRTDSQKTRQEPNGSIATAQDTPDDGPVKVRNM
jgi:hypothetical protein